MGAGRPKGQAKTGGRKKGTPNKTTEDIRKQLVEIIGKEMDNVLEALNSVRLEDRAKYLQLFSKYIELGIPKQQEIKAEVVEKTPVDEFLDNVEVVVETEEPKTIAGFVNR